MIETLERTPHLPIYEALPDPRTGDPLYVDDYLEVCITDVLVDPSLGPERPTTAALAKPVVEERLAMLSSWQRTETIYALLDSYTAAADTPKEEGKIQVSTAGRNLITEIVYSAQRRAFECGDPELSGQMVWLACNLINHDLANGDAGDIPPLLVETLHNAVAQEYRERAEHSDERPEYDLAVTGWYDNEDASAIRDVMAGLLFVGKMNMRRTESINFMLEEWGLDPEGLRAAWEIGFMHHDSRPEEFAPDPVVRANLERIATIEAQFPGISERLNQNRNIKCFARLSPEFLVYLDHEQPQEGKASGIFVALSDWLDAFNDPTLWDQLLAGAKKVGDALDYYEYGSKEEMLAVEEAFSFRYPEEQRRSILKAAHSDGYSLLMDQRLGSVGSYSVRDLLADQEHVQKTHKGVGRVALWGCSSDDRGGLVDAHTKLLRYVNVQGLPRIMGVRAKYTPDGISLIGDKKRTPAPDGVIPDYSIVDAIIRPARVRTSFRLSDAAELELARMEAMQAAAGF